MTGGTYAWVTHAPADYALVFIEDADGDHTLVGARFDDEDQLREAGEGLEGAEISDSDLCVYCTLPGEPERVLAHLGRAGSLADWVEPGTVAFVAVGDGSGTDNEALDRRREVSARIVLSGGGHGPRRYTLEEQCSACGEFRGPIHVLPAGGMTIDRRFLRCRCDSIPCRYCEHGRVRRPMAEHIDPERRAGCMPWFGYLVPCGNCQANGRGPLVQMST